MFSWSYVILQFTDAASTSHHNYCCVMVDNQQNQMNKHTASHTHCAGTVRMLKEKYLGLSADTHSPTHSSLIMITPPLTSCDEIDKLRSTKKTGYSWNSYTSQDQLVNIFCLFSGIKFIDWIICGLNMTDSVNNWLFHPLMTTTQQLYQKQ